MMYGPIDIKYADGSSCYLYVILLKFENNNKF